MLIGILVGSVVFANEARGIKSPIRNVDSSTSLDRAGDPVKVSLDANPSCEVCTFIKYIPGPIGKTGVAYKSAQPLDLTGAQRVVFFAKGELGGENVSFVAIGKPSNTKPVAPNIFTNLNFAVISKNVTLTNDWRRYQLSLNSSGTTGVTDPFGFIVSGVRAQIHVPASTSTLPPLDDPNARHIAFFLKGVTFDNNPAVNPVPKVKLSTTDTTATPTKATPANSLNATATTPTNTTNGKITPTKAATPANSLNATTATPTNTTNGKTTPNTKVIPNAIAIPTKAATPANSLNATTATPTKAATFSNIKSGTNPTTSSTPSNSTSIITTPTQGNAPLASNTQQPWHQWNESANSRTTQSPFINTTNPKVVSMSNTPTIPETFNPSSPTTGNGNSIPIKISTNQNVISSNASVSQKLQQPHVVLVPSQPQTQASLSTTNSGQPSHTWQNPAIGLAQKQQQPQVILVPAQHQNQSSLANTALQHPYQSQAPYPYQSQAPYPYQSQAPYPYQSQAPY
ncbi:MAG: hypothetical protein M3Y53_10565, partial [Thermoproteota archaeon]|nr:hypothetical protein [Thermoproteota archaeon]